jgi:restriction system protein
VSGAKELLLGTYSKTSDDTKVGTEVFPLKDTLMAIPDYQSIMLPLLKLAGDGQQHRFRDAVERLATQFSLTNDERSEMLPSGTALLFDNRVGWARTYLKQAGLVESQRRGIFCITDSGRKLLVENPSAIDVALLDRYSGFREFRSRRHNRDKSETVAESQESLIGEKDTPEDSLADAYNNLRKSLEEDVLEQVYSSSPSFFEQLVVDLLVKMGYGGSRRDAGKAIGQSGDEGIDGIINEDKLGLDVIYIQAKRWKFDSTVGRPEIQKFAGALMGKRAKKGVFITTARFSRDAEEFANSIESKVILIDGQRLATLMVDYNVGVATVGTYEVKKIDTDYFEGE